MIYRILMFLVCIIILFIPIYKLVLFLYKRFNVFSEADNLATEYEKNKLEKKQISQEINSKINDLKKEEEKLNKIKGDKNV